MIYFFIEIENFGKKGMKKRFAASLMAGVITTSMLAGCGSVSASGDGAVELSSKGASVEISGDEWKVVESTTESSEEKKEEAGYDDSEGRVVGPDAAWDGYFDYDGLKIRCAMSINEILEQGDYVVVPSSYLKSNIEKAMAAPTEMIIPPATGSKIDSNNFVYVMTKDGDDYREVTDNVYWYNPYPYAVALGDCVVWSVFGGSSRVHGLDLNGDGKYSDQEVKDALKIEPVGGGDHAELYPFEDFYAHIMVDDKGNLIQVDETLYGMSHPYDPESVQNYESRFGKALFDTASESLDTSADSYKFKMGLKEYTIDLSDYETIDKMEREYIEQSDYTCYFLVEGHLKDGKFLRIEIESTDEDYLGSFSHKGQYSEGETSTGEKVYHGSSSGSGSFQIENNSLDIYIITEGDYDAVYEMEQVVEGYITAS